MANNGGAASLAGSDVPGFQPGYFEKGEESGYSGKEGDARSHTLASRLDEVLGRLDFVEERMALIESRQKELFEALNGFIAKQEVSFLVENLAMNIERSEKLIQENEQLRESISEIRNMLSRAKPKSAKKRVSRKKAKH